MKRIVLILTVTVLAIASTFIPDPPLAGERITATVIITNAPDLNPGELERLRTNKHSRTWGTNATAKLDGGVSSNRFIVTSEESLSFASFDADTNGLPTRLREVNGVDMRRFLTLAKELMPVSDNLRDQDRVTWRNAVIDSRTEAQKLRDRAKELEDREAKLKEIWSMLAKIEEAVK